jgi:hypothetical protein
MTFKSNMMGSGTSAAQAGALVGGVSTALVATGTTQADALALSATNSQFATVASGTGAILPSFMQPGDFCRVFNNGANALLVYPLSGAAINNLSANAGFSVAANKSAQFFMLSPTLFGSMLSA